MPKEYAKYGFTTAQTNQYQTDINTFNANVTSSFVIPISMASAPQTMFEAIATAVGGSLLRLRGTDIVAGQSSICPEAGVLKPRKFRITLSTGETFSVPVNVPADGIIASLTAIRTALDDEGFTLQCADLVGEEIANVNDILGVNFDSSQPVTSGNGSQYLTARLDYQSDGENSLSLPVKVLTNVVNTPPPIFATTWAGCIGDTLSEGFACPLSRSKGSAPNKHRRFIVDYAIDAGASQIAPERREMPVNASALTAKRAEVLACGQAIAGNQAVFCIGYMGEEYRRIDKRLPAP